MPLVKSHILLLMGLPMGFLFGLLSMHGWGGACCAQGEDPAIAARLEAAMSPSDAIHDQLRALREDFIQAIHTKNHEAILALLHPEVIFTAQDGKNLSLIRRHDGVRRYLDRLLVAPGHGVESIRITPRVDDLSVLHGDDTAVAFGSSKDHYRFVNGNEFDLKTRWSVTAVKDGDRWLLANIHVSTNLFDNPILATLSRMALWLALGSFVFGLAMGYFAHRLKVRRAESDIAKPGLET